VQSIWGVWSRLQVCFIILSIETKESLAGEVSCQKLATFYEGTFAPTSGYGMPFKAQFEFKIDVNPQTKKITTQRKWNKSYSNSDLKFWLSNYNSRLYVFIKFKGEI
jgi:hypothetical protein